MCSHEDAGVARNDIAVSIMGTQVLGTFVPFYDIPLALPVKVAPISILPTSAKCSKRLFCLFCLPSFLSLDLPSSAIIRLLCHRWVEVLMTFSIIFLQPAGEHLAILLVGINKARVTGVAEQMPLTVRYILVKRGRHNGGTDVACTTTDEGRLRDLT